MGKNIPRKKQNDPTATKSNGNSLNGWKNSKMFTGFLNGGILEWIVRLAMIMRKRTRNAVTLRAQPNPIIGIKRSIYVAVSSNPMA